MSRRFSRTRLPIASIARRTTTDLLLPYHLRLLRPWACLSSVPRTRVIQDSSAMQNLVGIMPPPPDSNESH